MSWMPGAKADMSLDCPEAVEMVILPRTNDIGGFDVHRALPFAKRRMVGPFIFWDQAGPGEFLSGHGLDVRPHPHIGLATVTYLFDGTLDHRDSLGNDLRITPGDLNLMWAGAGITHSERTGMDIRQQPSKLYGIQSWIAQPKGLEAGANGFSHTSKADLPVFDDKGIKGRVILGNFHGLSSPVDLQWDALYVDFALQAGARLDIPAETEERALYVVGGRVEIGGASYDPEQMLVLHPGAAVTITAQDDVRIMLLGGATMDGPRYIWWNFVSSSREQIHHAAENWRAGKFARVPGDEDEFIPLPDSLPDPMSLKA